MDNISNRISTVIEHSKLTKTEFAERINVSQPFISKLAKGISTPSDRTIADICREFNVNEDWLRTGKGEMFLKLSPDEEFDAICKEIRVSDDIIKDIIKVYWGLSDDKKAVVKEIIDKAAERQQKKSE